MYLKIKARRYIVKLYFPNISPCIFNLAIKYFKKVTEMKENERLKEVRKTLKLKQGEMAEILGMKQGSYSYLESGRNNITERIKKILSTTFKLNIYWLETGEGYMFLDFKTLAGRIRFIMNEWGHNPRDFAYATHIPEPKVLKVLDGEEGFNGNEISEITKKYQLYSTNWILTGEGDIFDSRIEKKYTSIAGNKNVIQEGQNTYNSDALLRQENEALKKEVEYLKGIIEKLLVSKQ